MKSFVLFRVEIQVGDSIADEKEIEWYRTNEKPHVYFGGPWGDSPRISGESVEEVRERAMEFLRKPETIDAFRGRRFEIAKTATESKILYAQGGGCGVYAQVFICESEGELPSVPESFSEFVATLYSGAQSAL